MIERVAEQAIMVDGAGNTREFVLQVPVNQFYVPIREKTSTVMADAFACSETPYQKATFNRLGRLSDGRVVYGQDVASLSMWVLDITVSDAAQAESPIDIADSQVSAWMKSIGKPALCLVHDTQHNDERGDTSHHFEGVGKQL